MSHRDDRRVVYQTGEGSIRYCPRCGAPVHQGRCQTSSAPPRAGHPDDGIVRIARDRKSRGGKTVTIVTGLPGDDAALALLAQQLRKLCGTGGTIKDRVVELQGDHRERLQAHLAAQGYRVKLAGG